MTGNGQKLAVVTGAGSGIGRAIAAELARAGMTVVIGDMDLDGAKETERQLSEFGGVANSYQVDISSAEQVASFRDWTVGSFGDPDVLVNNAGWDIIQPFLETDAAFRRKVLEINLHGPVEITHAFVTGMAQRGQGSIVNIASDAGRVGSTGETVYAGAKGGIIAFTKSLAREVARYKINVNCVCPGPADTPLFRRQPEKMQQALERAIPFRRVAMPEDIAQAVGFLASEKASYITGQVLSVSGGLTMSG